MIDSFFLAFREGLEASLIIGIILIYLNKTNRTQFNRSVFTGAFSGVLASGIIGFILFSVAKEASEEFAEYFEVTMMLVAAGLIAYFILWLHRNNNVAKTVHKQVDQSTSKFGLFMLAFLSVTREGMELVIFNMTQVTEGAYITILSSVLGIVISILLAYIVFKSSVKLNLKWLFTALGVVLIYIGGHMFAEGLVELGELTGLIHGEELEEAVEVGSLVVYMLPALLIYFNDQFKKIKSLLA